MYITWLGHACFKLLTKNNGEEVSVVIDPFHHPEISLKLPRNLSADILVISHDHKDHNYKAGIKGNPFLIEGPGEYEVKKIFIHGIPTFHDQKEGAERGGMTIYRLEMEDISLAHLGDLGHILTNRQLEKLHNIDILMIPVGGTYTLNAKEAAEVISQIEPRIVIPMHYKIPGVNFDIDKVDKFCQEMGVSEREEVEKLKITKKDLPPDELKVIILQKNKRCF